VHLSIHDLEIDSEVAIISEAANTPREPAHTEEVNLLPGGDSPEMSDFSRNRALSEALIPFKDVLLAKGSARGRGNLRGAGRPSRKHSHKPRWPSWLGGWFARRCACDKPCN